MPSQYFEFTNSQLFEEEFEIQGRLGEGSFAKVYKCLERESGKTFAVKQLPLSQDFSETQTREEEKEIWKDLKHENIVTLHRTFKDNSSLLLVCEYMNGGSLFDEIVEQNVYSEEQARCIMKQVSKLKKLVIAVYYLLFNWKILHFLSVSQLSMIQMLEFHLWGLRTILPANSTIPFGNWNV